MSHRNLHSDPNQLTIGHPNICFLRGPNPRHLAQKANRLATTEIVLLNLLLVGTVRHEGMNLLLKLLMNEHDYSQILKLLSILCPTKS